MILIALLGTITLIIGITIYNSLSWGLVMLKFYTWFLLPVFITLPEITYVQAVGLALFATLFKNHRIDTIKSKYKDSSLAYAGLFSPWIILVLGWLIYNWFIL